MELQFFLVLLVFQLVFYLKLAGVDFVDSTGLGVLLGGLLRARRAGGDLLVSGLSPRLSEIFDLLDLGSVLAIVDLPEGDAREPGPPAAIGVEQEAR